MGTATVVLSGESIGTIDLIAGESHEANMLLSILDTIGSIFHSFWFKFFFALVIILVIGYIVLMIIRNHNRKKNTKRLNSAANSDRTISHEEGTTVPSSIFLERRIWNAEPKN